MFVRLLAVIVTLGLGCWAYGAPLLSASFDKGLQGESARGSGKAETRGEVRLVRGRSGRAVQLGRAGEQLGFPSAGNINMQRGSVAMWVKPVGFSPSELPAPGYDRYGLFRVVAEDAGKNLYADGIEVHLTRSNRVGWPDANVLTVASAPVLPDGTGGGGDRISAHAYLKDNAGVMIQWPESEFRHVVVTWDFDAGRMMIFMNGREVASTNDPKLKKRMRPAASGLRVGPFAGVQVSGGRGSDKKNVVIDDFQVHDHPLSAEAATELAGGARLEVVDRPKRIRDKDGLVLYYTFDDVSARVHDYSGKGSEGTAHGRPDYVQCLKGYAVRLDGKDDYIDCGQIANHEFRNGITIEAWIISQAPALHETGYIGKGLDRFGLSYYGWYVNGTKNRTWVPNFWKDHVWMHVAGTFDGKRAQFYCNGEASKPLVLKKPFHIPRGGRFLIGMDPDRPEEPFTGLIDEVRVYDYALPRNAVLHHYRRFVGLRGFVVKPLVYAFQKRVIGVVDLKGVAESPQGRRFVAEVIEAKGGATLSRAQRKGPADSEMVEIAVDANRLKPGRYAMRVSMVDGKGTRIMASPAMPFDWPEAFAWPGAAEGARTLNNMVVELLNVRPPGRQGQRLTFTNPREGWVFFSIKAQGGVALLMEEKDGEDVLCEGAAEGVQEAMRFLPAGEHRLRVRAGRGGRVENLTVRAIPELGYCYYPDPTPAFYPTSLGPKDEQFLSRHLLPNVNMLFCDAYEQRPSRAFLERWRASGRWYCGERHVTGTGPDADPEKIYRSMIKDDYVGVIKDDHAFEDPLMDAFIVNEFSNRMGTSLSAWAQVFRRLHREYPAKRMYAWSGFLARNKHGQELLRAIAESGGRCYYERYLGESPTRAGARLSTHSQLAALSKPWQGVDGFDFSPNYGALLGLISAMPEMCDREPGVDFKVFLDMQLCALANEPECRGLGAVAWYQSRYAHHEHINWAGRLFRHYCIEGNTDMLSDRLGFRYRPEHIRNPDFLDGLDGWTVRAATEGSVAARSMPGYGCVQGRYSGSHATGDTFLWTRRGERPNEVSQEMRGLDPGKLYSLRFITAHYGDVAARRRVRRTLNISVGISDADLVPDKSYQALVRNIGSPAHSFSLAWNKRYIWMNWHQVVFRPKGRKARLTISDWASPDELGGPVGHETMYNFVQVQRYWDGEEE